MPTHARGKGGGGSWLYEMKKPSPRFFTALTAPDFRRGKARVAFFRIVKRIIDVLPSHGSQGQEVREVSVDLDDETGEAGAGCERRA